MQFYENSSHNSTCKLAILPSCVCNIERNLSWKCWQICLLEQKTHRNNAKQNFSLHVFHSSLVRYYYNTSAPSGLACNLIPEWRLEFMDRGLCWITEADKRRKIQKALWTQTIISVFCLNTDLVWIILDNSRDFMTFYLSCTQHHNIYVFLGSIPNGTDLIKYCCIRSFLKIALIFIKY